MLRQYKKQLRIACHDGSVGSKTDFALFANSLGPLASKWPMRQKYRLPCPTTRPAMIGFDRHYIYIPPRQRVILRRSGVYIVSSLYFVGISSALTRIEH